MTVGLDRARLALPGEPAIAVTREQYLAIIQGKSVVVGGVEISAEDEPFEIIHGHRITTVERIDDLGIGDYGTLAAGPLMVAPSAQFHGEGAESLFIAASLSSNPEVMAVQDRVLEDLRLQGASFEAQKPEHLHITLLYIEEATDDHLRHLIEYAHFPAQFPVELRAVGTFKEADDKPVVLHVAPDMALLRIQTMLYERAISLGLEVSEYSDPRHYKPHITLAYNLQPADISLPRIAGPVRVMVDSILLSRKDYDTSRVIRLPELPGGGAIIIRGGPSIGKFERQREGALARLLASVEWAGQRLAQALRVDRHYGPGSHPSGSTQQVHAGDGKAAAHERWRGQIHSFGRVHLSRHEGGKDYSTFGWVLTHRKDMLVRHTSEIGGQGHEAIASPSDWHVRGMFGWQHGKVPMILIYNTDPYDESIRVLDEAIPYLSDLLDEMEYSGDFPLVAISNDAGFTYRLLESEAMELVEASVYRHLGPGPHPGTGTDQSVHAGDRSVSGTGEAKVRLEQSPVKGYRFESDDPYIRMAREIIENLPEEQQALIEETRLMIKEGQTIQSIYKDSETGEYPPERRELHEQIINEWLEGKTPGGEPQFLMTGGFPGAGKSTVFRQLEEAGEDFSNWVRIDSDAIKERLPEYAGWNAALTHQEASDIIDELVSRAASQRLNIVYDATMKTSANAQAISGLFENGGYQTRAIFIDVPIEVAMERAVRRFADGSGRFVDIDYIATHDAKNLDSFEDLKDLVDQWDHYDNNVPLGQPPVLVDSGIRE